MATEQEMLDRIAKLSSAIEQQKSLRGRGGYTPRGISRGRGYGAPGFRGRGGHMSLQNSGPIRPTTPYYPVNISTPYMRPPPVYSPVSHNRKLVLNNPSTPTYSPPPPSSTLPLAPQSQHRTLVINHKGNATTSNTMVKSIDAATGRKQVAIDGVDFVVKGKKLIRKDIFDSNSTKSSFMTTTNTAPKVLVRRTLKSAPKIRDKNKNMVLGKIPTRVVKRKKLATRSKSGNMVFTREPEGYVRQGRSGKSLVLNTQRKALKKPRYCGFFTRYGKCPNANRCPFQHDPNRRAICPRFLQSRCKKGVACKLSHIPNPNNMPHCVHFQKGLCKNDPCIYIHVRVSPDAPVCKAFAMEGFCVKGLDCQEKHVHVCPEFAETGKCSNANCRLPHVAKRTNEKNAHSTKTTGIIRLGSWVSPQYFHAQKMAKAEKRKAIEEAAASKVWTRPSEEATKEEVREKEEQGGFVRLFDDSDEDDGWSQFERDDSTDIKSLRFNDDDEDEEEDDDEEEEKEELEEEEGSDESDENDEIEENDSDDDSDVEEVYEEVSDDNMSDEE